MFPLNPRNVMELHLRWGLSKEGNLTHHEARFDTTVPCPGSFGAAPGNRRRWSAPTTGTVACSMIAPSDPFYGLCGNKKYTATASTASATFPSMRSPAGRATTW